MPIGFGSLKLWTFKRSGPVFLAHPVYYDDDDDDYYYYYYFKPSVGIFRGSLKIKNRNTIRLSIRAVSGRQSVIQQKSNEPLH